MPPLLILHSSHMPCCISVRWFWSILSLDSQHVLCQYLIKLCLDLIQQLLQRQVLPLLPLYCCCECKSLLHSIVTAALQISNAVHESLVIFQEERQELRVLLGK